MLSLLHIFGSETSSVEFELSYDDDCYDNNKINVQLSAPTSNERNLWLKKLNEAKNTLVVSENKQLLESSTSCYKICCNNFLLQLYLCVKTNLYCFRKKRHCLLWPSLSYCYGWQKTSNSETW